MRTITIQKLANEGMTADKRDRAQGAVKTVKHFDIATRPNSLTPYHSQATGDASASTHQLTDFLYYNSKVFGAGTDSGTDKITVHYKSDFTSSTWSSFGNNAGTTGTPVPGVFVEYHGKGYGFYNDGRVWANDFTGGSWTDTATTIGSAATTDAIAGIVHPKDDILYMATGNIIGTNNNGSWTAAALTLPSRYLITSLCEYGNYLAIACKPKYSGKSVVYLWDRDTTLNTLSDVIDFGTGDLQIIENIEGVIIGISLRRDAFDSLSTRLVFRKYSGGTADVFKELIASTTISLQLVKGIKQNQRLYFLAAITIDGTLQTGVWAVGKNPQGRWIVWFDRLPNNDTLPGGNLQGFFVLGDYMIISYLDGSGVFQTTQTSNNSAAYSGSSLIETVVNPDMPETEYESNKQLQVLAPVYEPLTSGQQVITKWKVDGGAWNTARTETTVGTVVSEISQTEAAFTSGREYEFRVESTGGAVITGLKYKYEVLDTLL